MSLRVDDLQRVEDRRIVGALDAEPDELEEGDVDDLRWSTSDGPESPIAYFVPALGLRSLVTRR